MMNNRRFIIVLLIITALFSVSFIRYSRRAPKRDYCDFRVYYVTGERFLNREDIYARPDEKITPFKYSPLFAMLMAPLCLFSKKAASLIFFSINFSALAAVFFLSGRLIIRERLSPGKEFLVYAVPFIFSLRFILQVLDQGQVTIIMFVLIVAGIYLMQKGNRGMSAACFSLSAMLKYMPLIFIPLFLVKRKIKVVAFILCFIILYCLVPAILVGFNTLMDYLSKWLPSIIQTSLDNSSWYDYKNQ